MFHPICVSLVEKEIYTKTLGAILTLPETLHADVSHTRNLHLLQLEYLHLCDQLLCMILLLTVSFLPQVQNPDAFHFKPQ